MPLTVITSDRFADHLTPPGHPERVERAEVMQVVTSEFRKNGGAVVEAQYVSDEDLARVHDADYLGLVRETAGRATMLDGDTYTSPDSYDVARLAAGAVVAGVDHVLDSGSNRRAFAVVRPPGHHAERDRGMGFCLYNSVAVAAAHARARGVGKVAIVDYDVHHGNGTQWSFFGDPNVLFISSHQYPFYPGSGDVSQIGSGEGRGFTVNLPVPAGATDADLDLLYSKVAVPVLRQFKPDLILLSAGFDAHEDDPLGGLRLTTEQLGGRLTALIAGVADECSDGRLVAVTEGGYDLAALGNCLRTSMAVLDGDTALDDLPIPGGATPRGDATLAALKPYLANFWKI